jgi:RNAse (barnase) inhibitor barstar
MELLDGVGKLANLNEFKFRYYKNFRSVTSSIDSLSETIPTDSDSYGLKTSQTTMENYKHFFSKSYVESIDMLDDVITISKKWADPLQFQFEDFGDKDEVLERLEESIDVNNFAEIIFLSKYIGDYNITKFGDKLMFENQGKALVAKRL